MLTSSDSTRDLVLKKRLSVCRLMLLTKHYLSSVVESKLCGLVHLLQIRFNMLFNLFMLQAYSLNTLTDVQRNAIRDLAELGLVKLQQVKLWFSLFPSQLDEYRCQELSHGRVERTAGSYLQNWLQISQQACQIHRLTKRFQNILYPCYYSYSWRPNLS